MKASGDRLALIDNEGKWSYRALLAGADKLVAESAATPRVAASGDDETAAQQRIAYLCPRDVTYVISMLATWRMGAIAVPLPDSHPVDELQYFLEDSTPCQLFATEKHRDVAAELSRRTSIPVHWVQPPGSLSLLTRSQQAGGGSSIDTARSMATSSAAAPRDAEAGAMIVYTSGTTNRPKGVLTSCRALRAQITALTAAWAWTPADRVLHVLPLHHVHGIMAVLLCALWSGAACEMMPRFSAEATWAALTRPAGHPDALTVFMAVPTIYAKLLQHYDAQPEATRARWSEVLRRRSAIRLMVSGSAALPEPVMRRWREVTGATLLERFGMTELGLCLSNPYAETPARPRKPSFVGTPLPGYEARIVDDKTGQPLEGPGQSGELQVRGEGLFSGYWRKPAATAESFAEGGWFRTGDSARRDADGYVAIEGRLSADIIKSGGYKLSALEAERHLLDHPAVGEVAVFGVPHKVWGETPVALVVPREGHPEADALLAAGGGSGGGSAPAAAGLPLLAGAGAAALSEAIRGWAKGVMAAYKVPTTVAFVQDIPRNAMGKVNKKQLKLLYAASTASAADDGKGSS